METCPLKLFVLGRLKQAHTCWHRCCSHICAGSEWEILEWLLANPREMDKIRTLDMEVQEGGCRDHVFASSSLWRDVKAPYLRKKSNKLL